MNIRFKILFAFIFTGILSVVAVGLGIFRPAEQALRDKAFNGLTAAREMKKRQIEMYFQQIRNQCQTFAEDLMLINAMKEFKKAYSEIKDQKYSPEQMQQFTKQLKTYYEKEYLARLNPNVETKRTIEQYFNHDGISPTSIILQYYYIANNPNPTGKKDNLDKANDKSAYSEIHAKYHPIIRDYLKKFGYYDVFLVDETNGNIVYTVFKEVDFSTSLLTGPYKTTNLSQAFRASQATPIKNFVKLVDFEYYDPSYAAPAAFISAPIFDNNQKIGVLCFQLPIDIINTIMTDDKKWEEVGFGKTGETYIVGDDLKMRTISRFFIQDPTTYFDALERAGIDKHIIDRMHLLNTTILLQEVNTKAAREAIIGMTDTIIDSDYRKVPVLSSFSPLDIKDVKWGILAEIDQSEVFEPIYTLLWTIAFWGIGVLILLVIFSFIFMHLILKPVRHMMEVLRGSLENNEVHFTQRMAVESSDDFGQLAQKYNQITEQTQQTLVTISQHREDMKTEIELLQPIPSSIVTDVERITLETRNASQILTSLKGQIEALNKINRYSSDFMNVVTNTSQQIIDLSLQEKHTKQSMKEKLKSILEDEQSSIVTLETEIFNIKQVNTALAEAAKSITKGEQIIKNYLQEINKFESQEVQKKLKESLDSMFQVFNAIVQAIGKSQASSQDVIKNLEQYSIKEKISIQDKESLNLLLDAINITVIKMQDILSHLKTQVKEQIAHYTQAESIITQIQVDVPNCLLSVQKIANLSEHALQSTEQINQRIINMRKIFEMLDQIIARLHV